MLRLALGRVVDEPLRLRDALLLREVLGDPFFVDLVDLERLLVDRLLDDRVVCAIFFRLPLSFLAGCAFAPTINLDYPLG